MLPRSALSDWPVCSIPRSDRGRHRGIIGLKQSFVVIYKSHSLCVALKSRNELILVWKRKRTFWLILARDRFFPNWWSSQTWTIQGIAIRQSPSLNFAVIWGHFHYSSHLWSQIMANRLENSKFFRLFWCLWDGIESIWNCMKAKNFYREQEIWFQIFEFEFFFEFDCWLDHFFDFRFQNLKYVSRNELRKQFWINSYVPATKSVATTSSSFLIAMKYHQNKSPCDLVSLKMLKKNNLVNALPELFWGEND